jgi:hypothetical protein
MCTPTREKGHASFWVYIPWLLMTMLCMPGATRRDCLLPLARTNCCDQHDLPVCGMVKMDLAQATRASVQSRRDTCKRVTPPVCGLINSIREFEDPWKYQLALPENPFQNISLLLYLLHTRRPGLTCVAAIVTPVGVRMFRGSCDPSDFCDFCEHVSRSRVINHEHRVGTFASYDDWLGMATIPKVCLCC